MIRIRKIMAFAVAAMLVVGTMFAAEKQVIKVADYKKTIRVACVGDSITFGAGVHKPNENSYPVQLGKLLGKKWETRNFGRSGATLLKKGELPYWRVPQYRQAMAYKPHVVIIKLGTNDSKHRNWRHKGEYVADYVEMIKKFQALESKPKVWICYPVPAYPAKWGITDKVIKGEVIPLIDKVAKKAGVPIIDLYKALSGKKEMFFDAVHPNADGAKLMAETIHKVLIAK